MNRVLNNVIAVLIVTLGVSSAASAAVISVDIQSDVAGKFITMAGVEANAAAADADFNAASVWNVAGLTSHWSVPASVDINPSWSNLVDSTGAATGVGFSITGTVRATEIIGFAHQNNLNLDSLFFANGGLPSTLTWEISGLDPGSSYKLYLNQLDVDTSFAQNRQMVGLIDTDGDGTPNGAYTMDFPGTLVTGIVAADGIIRGTGAAGVGVEPDWAGWQLSGTVATETIPVPAALPAGLALIGLVAARRQRNI